MKENPLFCALWERKEEGGKKNQLFAREKRKRDDKNQSIFL